MHSPAALKIQTGTCSVELI